MVIFNIKKVIFYILATKHFRNTETILFNLHENVGDLVIFWISVCGEVGVVVCTHVVLHKLSYILKLTNSSVTLLTSMQWTLFLMYKRSLAHTE